MVIKNIEIKKELFFRVFEQASKISKLFFIVNHGSTDNTSYLLDTLSKKYQVDMELINEKFENTMDYMKGKYYQILKKKYLNSRKFIFILDWDEVLDDKLVDEINNLDLLNDIYLINLNTYLINKVIDKNHFQPRLFELSGVEVNNFSKFHHLFQLKSKNIKKLKGVIHHYSYDNIGELINKNIFYSKGEAQDLFEKNESISNFLIFIKFLIEGTIYFIYTLFYHFNFLTLEGWLYSLNWYVYKYYKYLFYLELKIKNQDIIIK